MKNITKDTSDIKDKIHIIRGVQVMLDSNLAELYRVSTKRLNEQVKRNYERFPPKFMFQLTKEELKLLKSQNATSGTDDLRSQNATFNKILFTKRNNKVKTIIYTKISERLKLDVKKHNSQYAPLIIREFNVSHDRFMIIDNKDVYHIGASLKDLGKKWFAFSRFDKKAIEILGKLKQCSSKYY